MVDALCRQKGVHSKARIMDNLMASCLKDSHYDLNLPTSRTASRPDSAAVQQPVSNAQHGNAAAVGSDSDAAQQPPPDRIGNTASDNSSQDDTTDDSSSDGDWQPTVRVVQEHGMPLMPGVIDPLLFHKGIKDALASVLRSSAGQACQQGIVHSSFCPSERNSTDKFTLRLCPNRSKHSIEPSNICLRSVIQLGDVKPLYFPVGFDHSTWTDNQSVKAQNLYTLLESLHELFLQGVAAVNMY